MKTPINLYNRVRRKFAYLKNNYSFHLNNYLSNIFFGKKVPKYHKFYISLEDNEKLVKMLDNSTQLDWFGADLKDFRFSKRKTFQDNKADYEAYKDMSLYTVWFDIKNSTFLDNFLIKILPKIKDYLNSPFAIVNLRGWKSTPNAKATIFNGRERGAFRMHKDNMPPGHIKCMIYLNPLNEDYGKFQIDEEIFESEKPGLSLLFKNSDFDHQAISGSKYYRYLIELTIMKTFKNVDELKYYPGSPNSLYLKNAFFAYLN